MWQFKISSTLLLPYIVSGSSGSGKTFASMLLLRQIFASNGGLESDTFKQLSAAFTVLRSLGSAQTATNRESSRIGHFIEAQVSSGELYRTKIHCYFLDQVLYLKSISFKNNLVNSSNYKNFFKWDPYRFYLFTNHTFWNLT